MSYNKEALLLGNGRPDYKSNQNYFMTSKKKL